MEFESPIQGPSKSYTVPVRTTKYMNVKYTSAVSGSHTTPPLESIECMAYIADMATMYEDYSMKWFNRAVLSILFVKTVEHEWDHMSNTPYTSPPQYESVPIQVHQIWCPVKLSVYLNRFIIHWKLLKSDYIERKVEIITSGEPETKSTEVPYGKNQIQMVLKSTPRSEYFRKIRKARVLLAASKLRLHSLLLKYTEKYGELNNTSDSDSVLSFDSADN